MPNSAATNAIRPQWAAPAGVHALMSTRLGGVSQGAHGSLNLGLGSGDEASLVLANRELWAQAMHSRPVWLRQVHGARVLRLDAGSPSQPTEGADAAVTSTPGVACTAQAADCMPVLFAAGNGRAVGAAHAGWRGLAAGVVEACARAVCEAAGCEPVDLHVWMGPCIGPQQFEVGADVLEAFAAPAKGDRAFVPRWRPDGQQRWLADLHLLGRTRLEALGVCSVSAHAACTVEQAGRFFSYRRERISGRMAASICLLA